MNKKKQEKKTVSLCIVAGGSGGHILPALQLAKKWHTKHRDGDVHFFCNNNKLDLTLAKQHNFITTVTPLTIDKFIWKKPWTLPKLLLQLGFSFCKSFSLLLKVKPYKIITTGGIVAIPVCLAGKLLACPIELYELNIVPGKAIKFLSILASKIAIVFKKSSSFFTIGRWSQAHKCFNTSYPIRFTEDDKIYKKELIITQINNFLSDKLFLFEPERKTIFLLGGSQGSVYLNKLLKNFINANPELHKNLQIIHQTGSYDTYDWKQFYLSKSIPALTFSYANNIKDYYLLSNVIICRAGAGTLFEICFFNKKCVTIPLIAQTTNHQVANAREIATKYPKLFTVIEQHEIQKDITVFYKKIILLLRDKIK